MKWSIFKLLLAGGMAGMTLLPLCAQNDSIAPAVKERRWDKREHLRYDERWERLKPTHLKWQYAGGWDSTRWAWAGITDAAASGKRTVR